MKVSREPVVMMPLPGVREVLGEGVGWRRTPEEEGNLRRLLRSER